jgi:voltage-gated potassium channel Kch
MLAFMPFLAQSAPPSGTLAANHAPAHAAWLASVPGWAYPLVVIGAGAFIVVAGRLALRPVFRAVAASRLREAFTALGLMIVIGIALLMETVGMSPALGTFLAGVVLADSEFRHELESDIEPFKGLLLGLFFISVGASIDFGLLARDPLLIAGLVLALIIVKILVLFTLSRIFRFRMADSLLFAFALSQGGEFAFVLIAFAVQNAVFPADIASPLAAAVALSMLTTPLLLMLYERLIAPRFERPGEAREPDDIQADGLAIIAGFGRFGQISARLLRAQGFSVTVLDHSAEQVELLRRFGNKVYFGDASRADLLHAAGAAQAKVLIVAVDDAAKALEIVEVANKQFPGLKIIARAYDRTTVYEMLKHDVHMIKRETFGSALEVGVEALKTLGFHPYQAERAGRIFRKLDEQMIRKLAPLWDDDDSYMAGIRQSTERLEQVLQSDRERGPAPLADGAWATDTLVAEIKSADSRRREEAAESWPGT